MRYIRNISDDQNKSGDTDNIFRFNLLQGEDIFNFGDYPISINIANSSGYILSMVPEKEFGNSVLKLDFNDQSLKSLTPDNYLLEVEVKFPDGTTATFPTKGGMSFTVNSNLKNTAGKLVPTVTFDTVLEAVDKKVNNYLATVVKGDKGDTGVVDTTADYTWTGTNAFTQLINGSLEMKSLINVPVDLFKLENGNYYIGSNNVANSPVPSSTSFTVEVSQAVNDGFMFLTNFDGQLFWVQKSGGVWKDWKKVANDYNVVHTTGNETIAGDKTFTGSTTFTQPIQGNLKTRIATFTDFSQVATNMVDYAGNWVVKGGHIGNSPFQDGAFFVAEVTPGHDGISGKITASAYDGIGDRSIYYLIANWQGIYEWHKIAQDSQVIHTTGTETVAGDKTFTGNVSVTGSLDAKQKIYTRTINPVDGLSIIYKRVGNIVSGRFKADLSGDFQLNANDGYKSPSEYPVNVVVGAGADAWFTTDNKFHTNIASQGNFIFITNDPFPTD